MLLTHLRRQLVLEATAAMLVSSVAAGAVLAASPTTDFEMQVSGSAKSCQVHR